ncbi:hypothetical protein O3P69_002949 [Scylla paramamosain]|uniref:Tudor domain-containing protein 1 n=1 Tax=Scylla paramamosain TaxID=85552 RepID=A0AAW0UJR0_SCYPA
MNQSEATGWIPQVEEDPKDLQGIRFSRIPPQSRRSEMTQESRCLFVRNIPREMTNKDLQQLFSEFGHVVNVFLKPTPLGSKFNWAIINTESVKDMLSMMSAMNRKPPFNFEITVALSEDEKRQRKKGRGDFIAAQNTASWSRTEGQVKSSWPPGNETVVIRRGNIMMEGRRPQLCVFCEGQGQLRCSVCKAWYCSMVCQVDDWYLHKNTCCPPPVLDDPQKIKSSLCGTGGDASRGASAVMMSSSPFSSSFANRPEDISGRMAEEIELCSSQKSSMVKEIQPARNIRSMPTKLNMMTENGYSCGRGAMLKNFTEEESYSAGKGAVPKRSNMNESRFAGGCYSSPKRSIAAENVVGQNASLKKEFDKSPSLKCLIPKKSLAEISDDYNNVERGTSTSDLKCMPKVPLTEKSAVPTGTIVRTAGESAGNGESGSALQDTNSSVVSPSKNASEIWMNFGTLLEIEKIYSGFITLAASYEQFTAAVVVEAVSCIFSEAHEILSTVPAGINFKPEVGSLVAAYSPTEETWYRARVLELEGSTYRVCYIDFGNKEAVEQIKPVPEGPFSELPELAFVAKIHSKINEQVQEKLKKMVQVYNSLKFKVIAKKGLYVKVALCEDEDKNNTAVAEYILEPLLMPAVFPSPPAASSPKPKTAPASAQRENVVPDCAAPATTILKETSPSQRQTDVKVLAVNDSQKENGVISSDKGPPEQCNGDHSLSRDMSCKVVSSEADESHSCYVIAVNSMELLLKLEEMSVEMNQHCEDSPASMLHPRRGEVCLAKFVKGDGRWYRALCLASDSTCCQVIFVDYGNTEKVCHANIRPIPRQFLGLPCLALYLPQQGNVVMLYIQHFDVIRNEHPAPAYVPGRHPLQREITKTRCLCTYIHIHHDIHSHSVMS